MLHFAELINDPSVHGELNINQMRLKNYHNINEQYRMNNRVHNLEKS